MRITALQTIRLSPYDNILWLRLQTDQGLIGLGETFRGAAAVDTYLHEEVAPRLLGQDPSRIDAISRELTRPYIGYRSSGVEMRAASAVDIALWDLAGKAVGRPVHDLLGGLTRPSIRTYNTCAGYSYNSSGGWRRTIGSETAQGPYDDQIAWSRDPAGLARSLLEMGITAMKIWPFDPYAADGNFIHARDIDVALAPFRAIREAVGDAMEIMVELHGLWELTPALSIARAMQPFRPFWMEDPVKPLDPEALATYAERSGLPVCSSETFGTRAQFLDLLRLKALDWVMLDISWCGGLSEAKKIATLAEAHQRPVAPHDCTGPVVFAASTHLALNLPNAAFMESVRAYWSSWYGDLVTALPAVKDGQISALPGPGLGLELQPDVLTRGRVRLTEA